MFLSPLKISTSLSLLVCLVLSCVVASAQQPSPNVNVLPPYPNGNPSPPFPPPPISLTDALRGDGYLQRQVEPVIAVSTRNPDHLLAAFGDYRTVSIPNDTGLPEAGSASGWIGLSRSYDRGKTWFGSMVPCFPQDPSPLCQFLPTNLLTSGSDPVLATTPGGNFYLGGIFYNPGGPINLVAVMHYRDEPDRDGGDTIRLKGAMIVHTGGVADDAPRDTDEAGAGTFIDKPAIAGDHARGTLDASVCGPVYLAYTIFKGTGSSVPFQSTIAFNFSPQGSCGSLWSRVSHLNRKYKQNQGAAIAIDPRTGKIYVIWRHVSQPGGDGFPNSILIAMSSDGGNRFSYPVPITPSNFAPFDQPELSTANFPDNPGFRSNSFPTIAVDGNGNLYVADQEKTFPTGGGYPSGYYEPRVVIRTSTDGGMTWTTGSIVDPGSPSTYAQQFMPALSFAGGLLKLMWYDFREQNQSSDNVAGGYYVTGFDRQMKTYVAQSDLSAHANGNPVFSPSVSVTQYLRDASTGQIPTVGNIKGGYPAVNRPNLPMYSSGRDPFPGDYIWDASAAPFVPNFGGTSAFRWATRATDFIAMPSFGVWTDSRDVLFPVSPAGGGTTPVLNDIAGWQTYAPPGTGISCINAGARNANVYLSEIKPGVVAGTPATSRQLIDATGHPMERAFPVYIQNPNADTPGQQTPGKFFRISFQDLSSTKIVAGSFKQGTELTTPTLSLDLQILQYSSATVTLYVFCTGCSSSVPFAPFEVTVQEITGFNGSLVAGGLQTAIFFDSDPTAPFVTNPNLGTNEIHNVTVGNPQFDNPQFDNPQFDNPQFDNPQFDNPQFDNIAPVNAAPVGDFVYQITESPTSNAASGYTAVANVAQSNLTNRYAFELILSKTYNFAGANACNSQPIPQGSIISIIPNPQFDNPQFDNPQFDNPQFDNPQFDNATFATVPPPPGATATAAAVTVASTSTVSLDDLTTKMPLSADHVYFVLRVYRPAGVAPTVLTAAEQAQILANTTLLVFPQAPNTGTGSPVVQPPAPASSNKTVTTTSLALVSDAVFGQSQTFQATVTPTPSGGTVDFRDGTAVLQTVPLGGGIATFTTSTLAVGTHRITAVYSGDNNSDGSGSNAVSDTVAKANTTTSVVSNANPSVFGQPVTFTATVTPVAPGGGTPTGNVTFFDGDVLTFSAPLSGGIATFSTSTLVPFFHTIAAIYTGDSNFVSSGSNSVVQTVKANTTTTLASSANPSMSGQAVTLTATVVPVAPGVGTPTGTVNFADGEATLGAAVLTGGVATLTTSVLSIGTHTIAAAYGGDALFVGSVSNSLSQQVGAVVTNINDSGPGSLRQAILDVNSQFSPPSAPPLRITFNIQGAGVQTIAPQTDLPALSSPAIIDATTEPGYAGTPVIELNGSADGAGPAGLGLHISAGGSTVRGFVIDQFSGIGVLLDTNGGDHVEANYIGTDATGTAAHPNGGNGIQIIATPNNVVGGAFGSMGNVISGNGGEGIRIDGTLATGNAVESNRIGTDVTGSVAVGNSASGIYIRHAPGNSVTGNIVSGNLGFAGITICGNPVFCGGGDVPGIDETSNAAGNLVEGNFIGTDASGENALGNNQAGLSIDGAPENMIGTTVGAGNHISYNGTNDIQIFSPTASRNRIAGNTIQGKQNATTVGISVGIFASSPAGAQNSIIQNSISGHGGLGIDIAPPGVNPNTAGGANNYPVITSAVVANGTTTITGTLNGTANATYIIEFFSSASCNASGNGEGTTSLGSTKILTDGSGNAAFNFLATGQTVGSVITTTSTDASATTSEFSACATVTAP